MFEKIYIKNGPTSKNVSSNIHHHTILPQIANTLEKGRTLPSLVGCTLFPKFLGHNHVLIDKCELKTRSTNADATERHENAKARVTLT